MNKTYEEVQNETLEKLFNALSNNPKFLRQMIELLETMENQNEEIKRMDEEKARLTEQQKNQMKMLWLLTN